MLAIQSTAQWSQYSTKAIHKLLKPVFSKLRQAGHIVVRYLDDTILIAENEEKLKAAVKTTTDILAQLGFIFHSIM